jgi:hypothetical protein
MLRLVVCLDARRKRILIAARTKECVSKGNSDDSSKGEDKEGEELTLSGALAIVTMKEDMSLSSYLLVVRVV